MYIRFIVDINMFCNEANKTALQRTQFRESINHKSTITIATITTMITIIAATITYSDADDSTVHVTKW